MIAGQVQWDTEEYYLRITPEQLYSASEITFYALGFNFQGVPEKNRVLEDLQTMSKLGEFSQQLRMDLEPRYS